MSDLNAYEMRIFAVGCLRCHEGSWMAAAVLCRLSIPIIICGCDMSSLDASCWLFSVSHIGASCSVRSNIVLLSQSHFNVMWRKIQCEWFCDISEEHVRYMAKSFKNYHSQTPHARKHHTHTLTTISNHTQTWQTHSMSRLAWGESWYGTCIWWDASRLSHKCLATLLDGSTISMSLPK